LKAQIIAIQPPLPDYSRLRQALLRYMQLAKEDSGEQLPIPQGVVLPGQQYEGTQRLAQLLSLVGDLPDDAVVPAGSDVYNAPLVEAVKRFQQHHGLPPDGRIDADTLDQLNVPLSERVEQIRMAMERYRWLNYNFRQPPIIINIPESRLYALNKENKLALSMLVDVGQDYDETRTPLLASNIEYLVFRPYWDVPFGIQRDEIAPQIGQYSDYLSGFDFEVVTSAGKVVTDGNVTSQELRQIRTGQLRIRQKPGRDNSLGLVKFVFPNRYDVYLHDTPVWGEYFAGSNRLVSHGCIHVKEPAQLAAWMLRDKPGWTLVKVQEAMHKGPDNVRVNLAKPQPVLIVYVTTVVQDDGSVYFYPDIYGYDAELHKAFTKGYPYS